MLHQRLSLLACTFTASLAFSAAAHAQTVSRGPYLQNGSTTATSVRWRTDIATDSVVRYGLTPDNLDQTVTDATSKTEHEIRLTGLTPNTTYYYSVGNAATTLAGGSDYFVVTAPTSAKPTRIWVLGDAGWNTTTQASVRDAYYNFTGTRHTDLWLMLGDNAYNNGTDAEYTAKMFAYYPTMMRKSVLWSTYGNHDSYSADSATQTGPYYNQHTFPKNGEAGGVASGTEAYYSYDYGNIHFISLDSMESSRSATGAMANWLRSDLANTTKDWVVVFFHHPPYSKGSHNSDTETTMVEMRTNITPILEDYGVDLVLNGHSHSYERSYFIDGHYGVSTTFNESMKVQPGNGQGAGAYTKTGSGPIPHSGAVYTVAGASGITSGGTLNHPAMCVSLNVAGSLVLDVDGNRLDATYIDSTGATRDTFTMVKNSGNELPAVRITSPVTGASFPPSSNITVNATAADSDGTVTKVDFYEDGALIGSDTSSPYSVTWNNAPTGTHNLTAVATDNVGGVRTSVSVPVTVMAGTLLTFQHGVNGYAGTRDASLTGDAPTVNAGTSATLLVDGDPDYAALVAWDLSSVAPGTTVASASLSLNVTNVSSQTYEVYAVKRAWDESSVTFNEASAGVPWDIAGALGANDSDAVVLGTASGSANGQLTIQLNAAGIAKVQEWINNPTLNHGFILRDYANYDGLDVNSKESTTIANRPKLNVVVSHSTGSFQDGVNGYAGTRDASLIGGYPTTNYASSTALQHDSTPTDEGSLISWDLASIPSGKTVVSVSITYNVTNTSPQTYELYAMKRAWNEASTTFNAASTGVNWEVPGANGASDRENTVLSAITPSSYGLKTINLNAAGIAKVQEWINNPASNLGFILMDYNDAIGEDGFHVNSSETSTVANRPKITVTYY